MQTVQNLLEKLFTPPGLYYLIVGVLAIALLLWRLRRWRLREVEVGVAGPKLKFEPREPPVAAGTAAAPASTVALQEQLAQWRRNLEHLELKRARDGGDVSVKTLNEIAQAKAEIERLEATLAEEEAAPLSSRQGTGERPQPAAKRRQIMEAEDEGAIRRSQQRSSGDVAVEQRMTARRKGVIEDSTQEM